MPHQVLIRALASCFIAAGPDASQAVQRCERMLGRKWPWLGPVAKRFAQSYKNSTSPRLREVVLLLQKDHAVVHAISRLPGKLRIEQWLHDGAPMRPAAAAKLWPVPVIETAGVLKDWLWLEPEELASYADLKQLSSRSSVEALRHTVILSEENRAVACVRLRHLSRV